MPKRGAQLNFGTAGIKEFLFQSERPRCFDIKRTFTLNLAGNMAKQQPRVAEDKLPKWARILLELKAQVEAGARPAAKGR